MRIGIIGAGASGMMVAATLVEQWISWENIVLFDGNTRIGRKVAITGGGRCNVTTGIVKKQELLPKYIRGAEFVEYALGKFSPKKVREWFETNGVRLKIEEDDRVFPVSDRGEEIIECFERIFDHAGVMLRLGEKVAWVNMEGEKYVVVTQTSEKPLCPSDISPSQGSSEVAPLRRGVAESRGVYHFDKLVVATGGNAYAQTGSDGDGYTFARALGHTVTRLAPSLASFLVSEAWCAELSGIALPQARLETDDGIRVDGPMLFTHFGISGPAAFALSAHLAFHAIERNRPLPIRIIPDASRNFDVWERDLVADLASNPTKTLKNILAEYFPRRFTEVLLQIVRADGEMRATHVSRELRRELVKLLSQGIPLILIGRRPGDEFVTAGGVLLAEINPETMESRISPGLYFTGEVLDVDAVTGGFNLQACWATGRVCGSDQLVL